MARGQSTGKVGIAFRCGLGKPHEWHLSDASGSRREPFGFSCDQTRNRVASRGSQPANDPTVHILVNSLEMDWS